MRDKMELDLNNPVERVFADCVRIFRERNAKYTHANWDDNFQYVAEAMQEEFPDFTPASAARVLQAVKNARQDAARKSGREDFDDDSLRDSKIDDINYKVLELALEDQADDDGSLRLPLDDPPHVGSLTVNEIPR